MSHRSLEFYGNNTKPLLLFYITLGLMTKLPLLGVVVRRFAEWYGENEYGAYVLSEEEALETVEESSSIAVGKCACREDVLEFSLIDIPSLLTCKGMCPSPSTKPHECMAEFRPSGKHRGRGKRNRTRFRITTIPHLYQILRPTKQAKARRRPLRLGLWYFRVLYLLF
ncbi:hypothetical protein AKJ38_03785 [candidate division MSBL1 archaeon SCGC-AAA259I14]|uniref:Uncharacterized protein n=1 Tax=candidate division MSBL1 archaeon SCGC-AAA259I14 TaxID=1698268 RepID=A0A133UPK8_9EURY|nr:hypothetical protein AKJ38_03785 [candidate division MSBL1 archaeon SCGC-AAA259I14]